jgi:hypothetical protein
MVARMFRDSLDGLQRAADANLVVKATFVQGRTAGMRAMVSEALVWGDCGLPCDTFNQVCQARLMATTASERVRAVVGHYAAVGEPFAWWHSPWDQPSDLKSRLLDAGLQAAETELAMAADLHRLRPGGPPPDGLHIHRVRTAAGLRDFATIVAANWSPPDAWVLRFYELAAPVLLADESPFSFYVGYLDGIPVATSELVFGGAVAGLYSVCTLQAYRRRGFGAALATRPMLDAHAQGCDTAILQASAGGAGIYARLGFSAFGEITEYKPAR